MTSISRKLFSVCLGMGAAVVFSTGAWAADAAAGKALYATKCKTCHGADGTPNAAFAKMGVKPMKDIQSESDAALK
ncbi:MAG: c-type cytochrome, partial [Acidobacteriota bacterium]|nr:c-type cytochrome [Acidobacteriota bacterium]